MNHILCVKSDCPKRDTCIRYQTYLQTGEADEQITILNPRLLPSDGSCYRHAVSVTVQDALGFRQVLKRIPECQKKPVYDALMAHFGKNPYYDRRNGIHPITPEEQDYVRSVFREQDVTEENLFDGYRDRTEWVEQ